MAKSPVPKNVITIRRLPQKGDRVTFAGDVVRVLSGEGRPLLIIPEDSSTRLIIHSHWFRDGEKLRGSDKVELAGTMTKVVEGYLQDRTPVAVQVRRVQSGTRHTASRGSARRPSEVHAALQEEYSARALTP